jgi:hypothetical protein
MKTKIFLSGILLGLLYLTACDDTIDNMGMGILPDEDKIQVFAETMQIKGETAKIEAIYAKSIDGLLGRFYDPKYGDLQAGYICQYYPGAGFDSIKVETSVDSIQLKIMYTTYTGDSLSPMEVSVYPVIKSLEKDYYTNIDPANYCDMNSLLGKQAYTARDLNISDSANIANIATNYKVVSVPLPKELGIRFLDEWNKPDHGAYASPEALADFFPGTYLASTFGSGCILNVEKTAIYIYYTREHHQPGVIAADTTIYVTNASVLNVTKEVTQLNTFKSEDDNLVDNTDTTKMYLKTPAGVFSQVTIPIQEIKEKIGNREFSNVKLTLNAYPKEEYSKYPLDFPGLGTRNTYNLTSSKLMLIEKDSIQSFFETQRITVADNQTCYFTTYNSTESAYIFENISNVVQNAIDRKDGKDLVLFIIPVQVSYYLASDYYGSQYPVDYATSNFLAPSAVTLKRGGNNLIIEIIAADLQQ